MKSYLMEDKDLFILYCQYHDYWWPGDTRRQGVASATGSGIDLVILEENMFNFSVSIVPADCPAQFAVLVVNYGMSNTIVLEIP